MIHVRKPLQNQFLKAGNSAKREIGTEVPILFAARWPQSIWTHTVRRARSLLSRLSQKS
jgi:hypothetical protein